MRNWLLVIKAIIVVLLVVQCVSSRQQEKDPGVMSKDEKYNHYEGHAGEAPGPMSSDSAKLDSIKNSKVKKKKPG